MDRVLVTGATGFLGRHLLAALAAAGSPTVALARRQSAAEIPVHPTISIAEGDVRDAAVCAQLLAGVDTVFHLAAVRNRPGASTAEMSAVNEVATLRLATQAMAAGARRFVHVSTAQVFGPSPIPLDETAPLTASLAATAPQDAYAASKARAMLGLRELTRAGAPVVTLCPTIVFGPDHASRPNRVTTQVRRLLGRRFDIVFGGGSARRDLVHVGDVVDALLAAACQPGIEGEEILVGGDAVSQRELGVLVARCAGRRPPIVLSLPARPARLSGRLLDRALGYDPRAGWATAVNNLSEAWAFKREKAAAILGHRPRSLAQGIGETVRWIQGGQQR